MRGITKDRLAPAPWLAVPAGLALIFVLIPFLGMFVQVRWTDLGTLLAGEAAQDALWLSLKTTVLSTVISVLLGVPLAHVIAYENTRRNKPTWLGRTLTVLVTLPMVLPPVVAGLALRSRLAGAAWLANTRTCSGSRLIHHHRCRHGADLCGDAFPDRVP